MCIWRDRPRMCHRQSSSTPPHHAGTACTEQTRSEASHQPCVAVPKCIPDLSTNKYYRITLGSIHDLFHSKVVDVWELLLFVRMNAFNTLSGSVVIPTPRTNISFVDSQETTVTVLFGDCSADWLLDVSCSATRSRASGNPQQVHRLCGKQVGYEQCTGVSDTTSARVCKQKCSL